MHAVSVPQSAIKTASNEEFLEWSGKAFNEPPKAPISKRALGTDFEARWDTEHGPLDEVKQLLRGWQSGNIHWWTLRDDRLLDQAHPVVTESAKEWADELKTLDQLIVEGFEKGHFKKLAQKIGFQPDESTESHKWQSLSWMEKILLHQGCDADDVTTAIRPLRELHDLRNKCSGHANGSEASKIRKQVLAQNKSLKAHYKAMTSSCLESLRQIDEWSKASLL